MEDWAMEQTRRLEREKLELGGRLDDILVNLDDANRELSELRADRNRRVRELDRRAADEANLRRQLLASEDRVRSLELEVGRVRPIRLTVEMQRILRELDGPQAREYLESLQQQPVADLASRCALLITRGRDQEQYSLCPRQRPHHY